MYSSPKRSLLQETNKCKMQKFLWLHYTLMLIILVMFSLPLLTTALPHAIRIGAIFTGKTCNKINYVKINIYSHKVNKIILLLHIFYFIEDQKDSPAELAFKYAIYKINRDQEVKVTKVVLSYYFFALINQYYIPKILKMLIYKIYYFALFSSGFAQSYTCV